MCTRANRASVSDSAHALIASLLALFLAMVGLFVAMATAPVRRFRTHPTPYGQPASTSDVEVQVHLDEGARSRAIERSARDALKRAARTWAPHRLPLDRVEIYPSAPPLGRADIFDEWVVATADSATSALVVVSIGTAVDNHNLTADEIAGALTGQIERLVVERYQREHPKTETGARLSAGATASAIMQPVNSVAVPPEEVEPPADNVTDLSRVRVRALLADIKKSQPLVPAGSFTNGVHPETDPAS